jgi:prephenate dehydrogenase
VTRRFEVVTIIGVGLLGGSLALALKARGLVGTVRGVGHRRSSLAVAESKGAIDESFLDVGEAVRGAELIVVCTPAGLVVDKLDEIRSSCPPEAVVTDVASTKAVICAHAEHTWPRPLRFVGSHPMAGSDKFGPEHADPDLYCGSVTVISVSNHAAPEALDIVRAFWTEVGARIVELDPILHDALVARTSHVPHIMAACLAELAARAGHVEPVVGQGFRDMTRVAASRPELWRDICLTNRDAILESLDALEELLDEVRSMVAEGAGPGLEEFFRCAGLARRKALGE